MVECTLSTTHCLRLNLQLHTIDLVRTCRISSFCTVAWQLARFQLTRRIARSLCDSWASCITWTTLKIHDWLIDGLIVALTVLTYVALALDSRNTHTHTHLTALFPGLPGWASTRKVKPIWILRKQETVSGKSASRSTPAPHHSVFYRPDALPAAQPTASKHWRQQKLSSNCIIVYKNVVRVLAYCLCLQCFDGVG